MASLLPLISDILPMIMPSSVHVTRGSDIFPVASTREVGEEGKEADEGNEGQNGTEPKVKVIKRNAVISKSDRMCASVMVVRPNASTAVHHHGEQDTIIYVASGKGALLTGPKDEEEEPERRELTQGDFAFVPCWTEHQAVNESEEDNMVWVVIHGGSQPVEVNLTGWDGDEIKSPRK